MILGFLFFIQTFFKHCKALSTEKYKRCINILSLYYYILLLLLLLLWWWWWWWWWGATGSGGCTAKCAANEDEQRLDYDHGNITYRMFSSVAAGVMNTVSVFFFSGTGEEKMDAISRWCFAYDGMPGHLDLAISAPYVHSLCFPSLLRWRGFTLSESDTKGAQRPTSRVRKFKDVWQE